ncbi:hypothetical protein L5M51_02440 [Shewanella sp. SM73]|uniref:hypothetical protein n=1 Tax=unclassified Shewanella TaxID=196818 RepID=UPI001C5B40CD|nr:MULTISPECIES: hypothetical protein [unclassified Shewanella]MBW3513252.1 hypothetical protein [Shewanella sp. NKUCC01_JLK]MCU8028636.1 hypothetical protein [Shewanella sp. SM73]
MKFRPVFVLVTTVALTIFGYAVMFLYYLMQPQCIDDLSEISEFVLLSAGQGNTAPMHFNIAFDKEKNQWCYVEVVQ